MLRRTASSMIAVATLLASSSAAAQLGRPRGSLEPGYWVGVSMGYVEGLTLTDAQTGATWAFGYTTQLRATIEKRLEPGATIGLGAGFSTAPLTYTSPSAFSVTCPGQCSAHADIAQYVAFVRSGGGGSGLHGMYNLEGGVTQFSNFRDTSAAILSTAKGRYDPTFAFGGGFGYGFSSSSEIYAGEWLNFIFHKQQASSQSAPRMMTFRGGLRIGF